jgi:hypothetical protein
MDPFDIFEQQAEAFLQRLGRDHPRYPEALTLRTRLRENIAHARLYGDTETRRAERAQVLDALNRLSLETLGLALPDLSEKLPSPVPSDKRNVQVGGSVVGSVIITGDGNVVSISSPGAPPASPRSERGPLPLARAQVRIYAADGERIVGSGFLAGERAVLTCAHVVTRALGLPDDTPEPPPGQVSLDFPLLAPGQRLTARVARWRPQDDIAVLELASAPPVGAEPAPLVEGGDLWDHPFRAFGFPVGHPEGVWASGVVRGPTACGGLQIEDTKETGYRVQPGFSGAPVWDDALGGVVGMVAAAERDPSVRAAFIIPTPMLKHPDPVSSLYPHSTLEPAQVVQIICRIYEETKKTEQDLQLSESISAAHLSALRSIVKQLSASNLLTQLAIGHSLRIKEAALQVSQDVDVIRDMLICRSLNRLQDLRTQLCFLSTSLGELRDLLMSESDLQE